MIHFNIHYRVFYTVLFLFLPFMSFWFYLFGLFLFTCGYYLMCHMSPKGRLVSNDMKVFLQIEFRWCQGFYCSLFQSIQLQVTIGWTDLSWRISSWYNVISWDFFFPFQWISRVFFPRKLCTRKSKNRGSLSLNRLHHSWLMSSSNFWK